MKKFGIRFGVYFGVIFICNMLIAASKGSIKSGVALFMMFIACVVAEIITQAIIRNNQSEDENKDNPDKNI